jgi:hypothetical protein
MDPKAGMNDAAKETVPTSAGNRTFSIQSAALSLHWLSYLAFEILTKNAETLICAIHIYRAPVYDVNTYERHLRRQSAELFEHWRSA